MNTSVNFIFPGIKQHNKRNFHIHTDDDAIHAFINEVTSSSRKVNTQIESFGQLDWLCTCNFVDGMMQNGAQLRQVSIIYGEPGTDTPTVLGEIRCTLYLKTQRNHLSVSHQLQSHSYPNRSLTPKLHSPFRLLTISNQIFVIPFTLSNSIYLITAKILFTQTSSDHTQLNNVIKNMIIKKRSITSNI